ncbi:MAG: PocR ligand-binding domain-containing protein [Culicoidibacterales bacterium]
MSNSLNLNKVINLEKWARIQEILSEFTNVAMVTIDYKGNPVTEHSSCHVFCKEVRKNPELLKYCKKSDSRGGLEAVRLNSSYIYLCHFNVVEIAIPIIVQDKYIGAIMAGQVKLQESNASDMLEQIVGLPKNSITNKVLVDFKEYYDDLPVLPYNEIKKIAKLLFTLCNYLVEEGIDKHLILQMYEQSLKSNVDNNSNALIGYNSKNIEHGKKEISNALLNAYIKEDLYNNHNNITVSDTLKPAIEYIYTNKSKNATVEKMAEICHVSPSYFSRLFSKETGENFSSFSSKLKVEWAKCILKEHNISIKEISDELGFSEAGYFVKVFKKYEGITPAVYRKYYREN